jgi:hypothetical protein
VIPRPSIFDVPNDPLAYPKLGRYFSLWPRVIFDKYSIFFGKFRQWVLGASSCLVSSLFHFIVHIFLSSSKPQMGQITASRSIARMAHIHSAWNGTMRFRIDYSVRFPFSCLRPANRAIFRFWGALKQKTSSFLNHDAIRQNPTCHGTAYSGSVTLSKPKVPSFWISICNAAASAGAKVYRLLVHLF